MVRVLLLAIVIAACPSWVDAQLRVSSNPRYFEDANGTLVYLTGSHTWNVLHENGTADPPAELDFDGFLDFQQARGHNFVRLWAWDHTRWKVNGATLYSSPKPYLRSGPGTAADGKAKFDLDTFDQAFFDRVAARVAEARARGIYVSIMLWEGWTSQPANAAETGTHPFDGPNNINGVDADPNDDGFTEEFYRLEDNAITTRQEAYVRKMIDTTNEFDNVLYEIANEATRASTAWQQYFIDYIHAYEATLPRQHPVGFTFQFPDGDNNTLTASNADWVSPSWPYAEDPHLSPGNKVSLVDTDHIFGIGGNAEWIWKAFLRGHNPIYMDPYLNQVLPNAADERARIAMGDTRRYAERLDLRALTPAASGFQLSSPTEVLAFVAGSIQIPLAAGTWAVEWFNIGTSTASSGGTVTGGNKVFTPPAGHQIVYLKRLTPPPGT